MGAILRKFFADRGTHLAAMIAYFALLSFVPLLFLSLSLLGAADQADQNSFFVRELAADVPEHVARLDPARRAGRSARTRAALGLVGGAFLLWSSLSLFSVLESAFNIVYDRPNRPFLRGKALASLMMVGSLAFLFVSLVIGSVGSELLKRHLGLGDNAVFAYALAIGVSLVGVFVFLASAYVVLTNVRLSWREVLPGALVAAVVLEATFQLLPAFVRVSKHNPVLQTLSGPGRAARVALRDGERDRARRGGQLLPPLRRRDVQRAPRLERHRVTAAASIAAASARAARARCECRRFQASPSSATVRSSPAGTKIGS